MAVYPRIAQFAPEIVALRRDLHAHPELGFEEVRTSSVVAKKLEEWGIEVHRGIARTGVVGMIRGRNPESRTIGLRADMDALPMQEETNLEYRSKAAGVFHGCGHDGHTAILLATARYLSETRDFAGSALLVFQPAEEGLGGARSMIAEGLFERFPCDEIYSFHNAPHLEDRTVAVWSGPVLAAADFFDIRIKGRGSHAAMPHQGKDLTIVIASIIHGLQSIISRNLDPMDAGVISVTQINMGNSYNVLSSEAHLCGTLRAMDENVRDQLRARMKGILGGIAVGFEVEISIDSRDTFSALRNAEAQADVVALAAQGIVGQDNVLTVPAPMMGSEDFADMTKIVPGAYFFIGHRGTIPLHNPAFIFDDEVIPVAASILARIIEGGSA